MKTIFDKIVNTIVLIYILTLVCFLLYDFYEKNQERKIPFNPGILYIAPTPESFDNAYERYTK